MSAVQFAAPACGDRSTHGGGSAARRGFAGQQSPGIFAKAGTVAAAAVLAVVLSVPATAARHASKTFAAQTVPPVKGLVFSFDGRRFTTDAHGILRITIRDPRTFTRLETPGALRRNVRVVWGTTRDGATFRLQRWYRGTLHANASARATLQLMVPTHFRFVGPHNKPWALRSIGRVTLKRHDGSIESFPGSAFRHPISLQGTYVAPNGLGALLVKEAQYRIQSVIVNGTNVVNRGQIAVYPQRQRDVRIRLLFYPLALRARDRLFATAIGSGVNLKYPDGHVRYFPFRHGARLDLPSLPRGSYVANVSAPAIASGTPIALTRGQVASVALFSYLDVAVIAGVLIFISTALWWAGHGGMKRIGPRWSEHLSALSARPGVRNQKPRR